MEETCFVLGLLCCRVLRIPHRESAIDLDDIRVLVLRHRDIQAHWVPSQGDQRILVLSRCNLPLLHFAPVRRGRHPKQRDKLVIEHSQRRERMISHHCTDSRVFAAVPGHINQIVCRSSCRQSRFDHCLWVSHERYDEKPTKLQGNGVSSSIGYCRLFDLSTSLDRYPAVPHLQRLQWHERSYRSPRRK